MAHARRLIACFALGVIAAALTGPALGAGGDSPAERESIGDIRDRIAAVEQKKLELVKTLALVFEARNEVDRAIEYMTEALMLDADDQALASKLVSLLRQRERWADMVPVYERLIAEHPGASQQYMLELGRCHFKLDQEDKALEVLERYRRQYADYQETYLQLASVLADHGHMAKAAAILEEAVANRFKEHYKMHWQLGVVYVELGDTAKAIRAYEKALDLVSPGADRNAINSRLIALYKEAGRIDEVIEQRETEIDEIDAKLIELYWALAQESETDGQLAAAVDTYRKIVAIAPDSEKGRAAAARVAELEPTLKE